MIDERGQPISPEVVGPGGLGPVDRVFAPGELAAADGRRQPLAVLGGDDPGRRTSRRRGLRPVVSLRGRLGLLAAGLAEMEGRLAGAADRPGSLARRAARPTASRRAPDDLDETSRLLETALRDRLEGSAGCRRACGVWRTLGSAAPS